MPRRVIHFGFQFFASALVLLCGAGLLAGEKPETKPLSKEGRIQIIRGLNAEFVFVRKMFPMGNTGLRIKDGEVTPADDQLRFLVAQNGPAARPGDRAQITDVTFKGDSIIFELNGGPKKKKKWYQHIEVGGSRGMTQIAPDSNQNPHGSFVKLEFDHDVPDLTPDQVKQLLKPVFDFSALSAAEAYIDTMPPKVKTAMKNHQVLVGMNREMVEYCKGQPPRKIREKDDRGPYEEWIYGAPPDPVEFIRFYGDSVGRIETMNVDGNKVVRTVPEVVVSATGVVQDATLAQKQAPPAPAQSNTASDAGNAPFHPSLRRPGESADGTGAEPADNAAPPLPVDTTQPAPPGATPPTLPPQ
jgi:hypothetical protein